MVPSPKKVSEAGSPSCRGAQFDKTSTRYVYWEVFCPSLSVDFNWQFLHMYLYIASLVVVLRNWVCDGRVPPTFGSQK